MIDKSRVCDAGSIDNNIDYSPDNQTQNTKKRKEMQPRYEVWDYFDKVVENGIGEEKC
ncbi:hypothetical protein HAX54_041301, partial [Datura stramonium]|nr:hypothetical protein [Datura stramonium]